MKECVQNAGAMYEEWCDKRWEELNKPGEPMIADDDKTPEWHLAISNLRDAYYACGQLLKTMYLAEDQTKGSSALARIASMSDAIAGIRDEIGKQIDRMEERE